jgi:hypothetical protein
MPYIVIGVDGELVVDDRRVSSDLVRETLGDVADRVETPPTWGAVGWVAGNGLNEPDRYPLNPVGGALLASIGATSRLYAGPVVVTGYHHRSTSGGPVDLDPFQIGKLNEIHAAIQAALVDHLDEGSTLWASQVRDYVAAVRGAVYEP